jgi:DNA-binding transcriptional MerR regulator
VSRENGDPGKNTKAGQDTYTIGKLARQAKVTSRTVRFYVAEGLLPPPMGAGRAAVYTGEHVTRLELIKLLKDEFLPLGRIRDLLAGLTQAEIEELLAQKRRSAPSPGQESAREYVRTLLQTDPETAKSPAMLRQVVARHKKAKAVSASSPPGSLPEAPVLAEEEGPATGGDVAPAVTWGRISLHPDVELNVRHPPTDPRTPARIQNLLDAARRLFKL